MTSIVTGGAGFIGSHLVDALAARGERVLVIDDMRNHASGPRRGGYWARRPDYCDDWSSDVHLTYLSVADADDARQVIESHADTIYHLADPVGPVGLLPLAGHIASDILRDAASVRDWASRFGARLIYVSTSEVYGSPEGLNSEHTPRTFQHGHSARMEYAVAKLAAETMLRNTPDLDVRIVRPFNVAGPRQREDGGFVLPRFIRQALAGEPLTVYTPGTQRRAFTHVRDIVEGIVLAAERGKPGEDYNLGNAANECDILTLAREVLEVTGSSSAIEVVDPVDLWGPAFREAPDKVPDATKAARELGWVPKRDRRRTIVDALADVRQAVAA